MGKWTPSAPPVSNRYNTSVSNQPYIPSPPAPKKVVTINRNNCYVTWAVMDDDDRIQPQYKKSDSIPIPTAKTKLVGNRSSSSTLSGISDVGGIDGMGSDDDDGLMINTDDEESSSYNINNGGHSSSNNGSIDSTSGSLDSLFTNDGGNRFIDSNPSIAAVHPNNTFFNGSYESTSSKSVIPPKKMRLFNVMTNVDNISDDEEFESDLFDCNCSVHDNDERCNRFRAKKVRSNHEPHIVERSGKRNKNKKKSKKKGKKLKKKKGNKPLVI